MVILDENHDFNDDCGETTGVAELNRTSNAQMTSGTFHVAFLEPKSRQKSRFEKSAVHAFSSDLEELFLVVKDPVTSAAGSQFSPESEFQKHSIDWIVGNRLSIADEDKDEVISTFIGKLEYIDSEIGRFELEDTSDGQIFAGSRPATDFTNMGLDVGDFFYCKTVMRKNGRIEVVLETIEPKEISTQESDDFASVLSEAFSDEE